MTDKKPSFKVPALNLTKNLGEDQESQMLSTQASMQTTASLPQTQGDATTTSGSNQKQKGGAGMQAFLTARGADDPYKIQGLQDKEEKKQQAEAEQSRKQQEDEDSDQEQKPKKKRRRKNKNKNADRPEDQQPPTETGIGALKDEISQSELYADSDASEDEGIADYKVGGYHPVHIGERLTDRYIIVQKLGWGHFSTVWLAKDCKHDCYVALKVQKSASHYVEAAYDEVEILDVVSKNAFRPDWVKDVQNYKHQEGYQIEDCHTVQLLNSFMHCGPNGQHFVMVFEILGVNLLEIMKRYDSQGIPIPLVRRMAKQILIGLDYLHRVCKIIHTDLKPENVSVALSTAELDEIQRRGQISTVNKTVKTQDMTNSNLLGNNSTLLGQVDTTGLNKQQKKKLKKKLKKEKISSQQSQVQPLHANEDQAPAQHQIANAEEQMLAELENEDSASDHSIEMPRSCSAPGLGFKLNQDYYSDEEDLQVESIGDCDSEDEDEDDTDSLFEEGFEMRRATRKRSRKNPTSTFNKQSYWDGITSQEQNAQKYGPSERTGEQSEEKKLQNPKKDELEGQWQFKIKRDFPREIESFFQLKEQKVQQMRQKADLYHKLMMKKSGMHERGPLVGQDMQLKICDLGNGCWTHYKFTNRIQTRQYRGPEIMLGIDYDQSADLWSFACMIFELITGDFLFDPRKGQTYSKTDDHLAQMMELLGPMPKNYALAAKNFNNFFAPDPLNEDKFIFKKIDGLKHFPLEKLLTDKYKLKPEEAKELADFLLPMLKWRPSDRPTAQEMLNRDWLKMPDEYDYRMCESEWQDYSHHKQAREAQEREEEQEEGEHASLLEQLAQSDDEANYADSEDNVTLDSEESDRDSDIGSGDDSDDNLNGSFTGGYVPNRDIHRVDKGQGNPQFTGVNASEESKTVTFF